MPSTIVATPQIVAYGFIVGPNTYLKDEWNWMDFVVVLTGLLSAMIPDASFLRAPAAERGSPRVCLLL